VTIAFFVVLAITCVERLVELVVGTRNRTWSLAQGGIEYGQGHWPWMVTLHTVFLLSMAAEVLMLPTSPTPVLAVAMITIAVAAQALRWWCIHTLGQRWNPRVIVIPGLERVTGGPYKWLDHPNYVAVVLEGVALPMIHGAWRTALGFTACNAILLWVRIDCENRALHQLESR
jgi:methyltransferase